MKEISGGIATLVFTDRWLSQRGSRIYMSAYLLVEAYSLHHDGSFSPQLAIL